MFEKVQQSKQILPLSRACSSIHRPLLADKVRQLPALPGVSQLSPRFKVVTDDDRGDGRVYKEGEEGGQGGVVEASTRFIESEETVKFAGADIIATLFEAERSEFEAIDIWKNRDHVGDRTQLVL